jgi:hypothetical protein
MAASEWVEAIAAMSTATTAVPRLQLRAALKEQSIQQQQDHGTDD